MGGVTETDSGFDQAQIDEATLLSIQDQERKHLETSWWETERQRQTLTNEDRRLTFGTFGVSANNDRRFSEANLVQFAEITGSNLNDVKRFAAAVEEGMPDEGCTDDELMKLAMSMMAPRYRIDTRHVKHAFQQIQPRHTRFVPQAIANNDRRFSRADLAQFAENLAENLHRAKSDATLYDVKRLAAAVEECMHDEGCTEDEVMTLAMNLAPVYRIDARHAKHALQQTLANEDDDDLAPQAERKRLWREWMRGY